MKSKLRLMFIFMISAVALAFVHDVQGQGMGDRNRAADGGDGRYSIQGKVYLPNGQPAANAKVSINSADAPSTSAVTNIDGIFQVGSLRAGNYHLSVKIAGLPTENENLTIDRFAPAGKTFNVVFNMRQEGQPKSASNSSNPLLKGIPKEAVSKFEKGMEKMEADDAKGAVAHFDEAIAAHPNFAAAYYEKGAAHLKANDPDKALEAFIKAVSIKPDYIEAKYSVGYTQFLKKNYEVASAVFVDVLKQKNDMPLAYMYLGISLIYMKNVDAAEESLKRAIAVKDNADVALAHRYLGGIYLQKKRNAEAAAELQKYLDMVPKAPDADRLKTTIADLKKKS